MPTTLLPDDADDIRLRALVAPPDWVNPTPAARYHLVVVGAGTAGLVCAAGAAGLGAKVALVERDLLGGDCLNAGCVPSKALLAAAGVAQSARRAGEFGVRVSGDVAVDFPAVMARLRNIRASLAPHDSAERFRGLGVDVYRGEGTFTSPTTLVVDGRALNFGRAVIATGGRAAVPDVPGLAEAGCLTNESVFALRELPARLAVIGGGPIGCELSQAFARLGSRVTLLTRDARLLPREDADAAGVVQARLAAEGVEIVPNAAVRSARREGGERIVTLDGREVRADAILVAAGRKPNVEGMGLEAAGVRFTGEKGVEVDATLRTSARNIFAAGDVCSRYQFTHAADAMARIVVRNALFPGSSRADGLVIPWCTYTEPELARVGLSEAEAAAQGVAIDVLRQDNERTDRYVLAGEAEGFVKVLLRKGTDRIVGACAVGANAGEMISEVATAMTRGFGLAALGATIRPYPTRSEALRRLADARNRTRLTPWVKWAIGTWLRWMR